MVNAFPKTTGSVAEWLDAIQMSQYKGAFEAEGVAVSELREISTAKLRELVPLEGHRRRIVLALHQLEPTGASQSVAASVKPSKKFNSTSSVYIDSTITKPCVDEIIFCVAVVLYDRIEEGEAAVAEEAAAPDGSTLGRTELDSKLAVYVDKPIVGQTSGANLTEDTIFQTIKAIFAIAEFSAECLVISLLYIERVRKLNDGFHLRLANWQPLLLSAMLVAQKVWDDKSLLNVDFSLMCSAYTVKDINNLEKIFLEMIQYNVTISASLYASYYFELRTLCEKAERTFTLKSLSETELKQLESRSEQKAEDVKASRRWQSAAMPQTPRHIPE